MAGSYAPAVSPVSSRLGGTIHASRFTTTHGVSLIFKTITYVNIRWIGLPPGVSTIQGASEIHKELLSAVRNWTGFPSGL